MGPDVRPGSSEAASASVWGLDGGGVVVGDPPVAAAAAADDLVYGVEVEGAGFRVGARPSTRCPELAPGHRRKYRPENICAGDTGPSAAPSRRSDSPREPCGPLQISCELGADHTEPGF